MTKVIILIAAIIVAIFYFTSIGQDAMSFAGIANDDKLGWMDDLPLTKSDRERIAAITGISYSTNEGVIKAIQSGSRGNLTRRDFELLRQDRRRAQAAYPDVKTEALFGSAWFNVDFSARVPSKYCTSGNSNGTQGHDGKWYLDGGCYLSYVKNDYPNRADAATTKQILADLNDKDRQKELHRMQKWGTSYSSSGTGGSISVDCYPDPLPSNVEADDRHIAGQCVIILDQKTKYVFPFIAAEWLISRWDQDKLTQFAESKGATPISYTEPKSKPWIIKDGLLAHGEVMPKGRLYWSWWNGDGYDNRDIGPDTPESWVLEHPFGIAYLPAPDNGERRSVKGKLWYLVASYYGYPSQASGGWTEKNCKAAMPKLTTGFSLGMQGQDNASLNHGNLREVRCTQVKPLANMLPDLALPTKPFVDSAVDRCVQGGTLMPGHSCRF